MHPAYNENDQRDPGGAGAAPHTKHSPSFSVRRRSHPTGNSHDEARELRRMVQERDDRIATLEEALQEVRDTALDLGAEAPEISEMLGVIHSALGGDAA